MKKWDNRKDTLWLLTEEELDELPDGSRLLSINNDIVPKTADLVSDTRFGVLAYGLTETLAKQQGLEDKFLVWMMKS